MADDSPVGPAGGAEEPTADVRRSVGLLGAFLPLGVTFMILGMTQGIGDGSGTAFFVIGVTFLLLALTTGGAAFAARSGRPGAAEAPEVPEAPEAPEGEADSPGDGAHER